jgi:tRNA dimethylallyltransferase
VRPGLHHAVAIVGTTGSGKSAVALAVAGACPSVEIVSVDSMSVYRGMDLGTAKPSVAARRRVVHHLIDLVDPCEAFTVLQFQEAAHEAMDAIAGRGNVPLLVGGTGLYLRAVVDDLAIPGRWPQVANALEAEIEATGPGSIEVLHARLARLDPLGASRIGPANRRRVVRALEVTIGSGRPFSSFGPGLSAYPPTPAVLIGLPYVPEVVDRRITERFEAWLQDGLLDEVRALAARPQGLSRTARQAVGYRELLAHVESGEELSACVEAAIRRTQVLARRQWAWFRRDPRIRWVDPGADPVGEVLQACRARTGRAAARLMP